MTTTLHLVLDQIVAPNDSVLESASLELARALVLTTPKGCEVEAIVPATGADAPDLSALVPGLARVAASLQPPGNWASGRFRAAWCIRRR